MKSIQIITIGLLGIFLTTSCDINDTMDDAVLVGKMAPHVHWEVGSSNVSAGSNVPFMVQYYSTSDQEISHLEVWFDVLEEESKSVICPWTQTFNFSMTTSRRLLRRIPQLVARFNHQPSFWNDSLRAYTFTNSFPTSNTLSNINWNKPSTFDAKRFEALFGEGFAQQFKDSLFKLMRVTDFQRMYLGLNLVDNFKIYLDSTWNQNSGSWVYHFPKDAQGNTPVPNTIVQIYQNIPFHDLIFNGTTNVYEVEYNRSYMLNAHIRVVDEEQTAGISRHYNISLN